MCAKQIVFKADEIERLRNKIKRLGEDTNQLYMKLRGQSSNWSGIPLGGNVQHAQNLVIRLMAGADKLEDAIRQTQQGVERLQGENKRTANQWGQQLSGLERLFGLFGSIESASVARIPIPSPIQNVVTNLIQRIVMMSGRDEMNQDEVVQKLQGVIQQPGISVMEKLTAQIKLSDIYAARDQIAKAQTAYDVYKTFGNKTQMEAMHKLAEEARRKLEAFGVNEIYYQAGKNLTSYFKKPALQACDYDPSIITASVPLIKNENYQMLLQMAMMQGDKGKWAKSQLDGIHRTMKQMITVGVSLGVNVMTNQGRGAWGDVAQLAGLLSRLASYNLFTKKKMDIEKEPEKSKNAFFKSLDSFKEIGTGFIDTLENRSNKYLNSPYDFFNWLTLGITGDIPTAIYTGAKERADHMWDSKEKFADWLALGTLGMAKGAFNPEEAWSAEHWMNSLGMATILFGPVEGSLLSKGGLKPKFPETFGKDNLPNQGLEILGPNPVFTTPEGLKFKFNDIQTDSAILPKTPVQKHYLNEIDRIRKGLDEAKGAGNKGVSSTNFKNIDDFLNGIKKFDEVIDDYAKVYKERIESNKPWSWDDTIPGGDSLSSAQKRKIKELAVSKGHIPEIKINKVDGMRYGFADFAGAGVVEKTVILPERFWGLSDKEQFRWLDEQIGGTKKGMTWHHTEIPGKMELVPFGIHNITPHNGGRTAGMWADAPR